MDKALKQRLVGASVLIILTVIVLPMLLSGRSDTLQQDTRQIELPQKPQEVSISKRRFPVGIPDTPIAAEEVSDDQGGAAGFVDDIEMDGETITDLGPDGAGSVDDELRLGDQSAVDDAFAGPGDLSERDSSELGTSDQSSSEQSSSDRSLSASEVQTDELQTGVSQAAVLSEALPETAPAVAQVVVEPSVKNADLTATENSDTSPRYLVQVASFSSEKRADSLATELRGSGMNVEVDIVERNGGRLHRVRVGAYASRADADVAVTKIKTGNKGLNPRVMDLRPGDAAPVSTPSDPLVRWVVQVGSFSSAESAESQVAQLRLAGLPAFSEKVTSSSGSVYKVRVGPEINRDKATKLAERIQKEQNLKGFVTTQE